MRHCELTLSTCPEFVKEDNIPVKMDVELQSRGRWVITDIQERAHMDLTLIHIDPRLLHIDSDQVTCCLKSNHADRATAKSQIIPNKHSNSSFPLVRHLGGLGSRSMHVLLDVGKLELGAQHMDSWPPSSLSPPPPSPHKNSITHRQRSATNSGPPIPSPPSPIAAAPPPPLHRPPPPLRSASRGGNTFSQPTLFG